MPDMRHGSPSEYPVDEEKSQEDLLEGLFTKISIFTLDFCRYGINRFHMK